MSNLIVKKQNAQLVAQALDQLDDNAPCYYVNSSLHVLPKKREELEGWLNGLQHSVWFSYQNEREQVLAVSLLTFEQRAGAADLSIIVANPQDAERVLPTVLRDAAAYAFESEPMQRITLYAVADDQPLLEAAVRQGFEIETTFPEAFWKAGAFTDVHVLGKYKDLTV